MFGIGLGMVVEASVAVLLAVTIGYCVILNARLKRLHADRETLQKMVGDLMQATALANADNAPVQTAAAQRAMILLALPITASDSWMTIGMRCRCAA